MNYLQFSFFSVFSQDLQKKLSKKIWTEPGFTVLRYNISLYLGEVNRSRQFRVDNSIPGEQLVRPVIRLALDGIEAVLAAPVNLAGAGWRALTTVTSLCFWINALVKPIHKD